MATHATGPSRLPSLTPGFPLPNAAEATNEPTLTLRTLLTREQARTTVRAVPVVSLKVAAGAFSAAKSLEDRLPLIYFHAVAEGTDPAIFTLHQQ